MNTHFLANKSHAYIGLVLHACIHASHNIVSSMTWNELPLSITPGARVHLVAV